MTSTYVMGEKLFLLVNSITGLAFKENSFCAIDPIEAKLVTTAEKILISNMFDNVLAIPAHYCGGLFCQACDAVLFGHNDTMCNLCRSEINE